MIDGPVLTRWTSIAIHEPTRAWPWSRTRAVIVGGSAARARPASGPTAPTTISQAATVRATRRGSRRCARRVTGTPRADGVADSASTPRAPEKLRRAGGGIGRALIPNRSAIPPAAEPPRLSYDAVRGRRPRRHPVVRREDPRQPLVTLEDSVPQIRPFRALRYVPESVGDLAAVVAPPYDVLDRRGSRAAAAPDTRRTSSASMRRPTSPATPRTIATAGPPGPWPAGAPTGRSTRIRGRRSTSTSRRTACPGTDVERTQRGFFGAAPPRAARAGLRRAAARAHAGRAARGSLPAAARDRRQHEPGVGLYDDPSGRAAALLAELAVGPAAIDVRDDDGDAPSALGRRRRTGSGTPPRSRELIAIASARARHDRRWPPSLRDRAPLPRRAPDEPVVRGGSGVRLPADAVPRDDRRAADRPADAPGRRRARRRRRSSACEPAWTSCSRSGAHRGPSCSTCSAIGRRVAAAGGAGHFGLWTRSGGALLAARRAAFEPLLPAGRPGRPRDSTSCCSASRSSVSPGSTRPRSRPAGSSFTKSAAEAIDAVDARRGRTPTPRSCSSRRRSRRSPRSRGDGDVMPQKSTYFYPKALTGLLDQPAGVVNDR